MKTPLLALLLFTTAAAGQHATASEATALPGVKNDYKIVQPAPAPEPDDAASTNSPTHFWVGKTEVKIKGELRIDVTAGDGAIRPNPNR